MELSASKSKLTLKDWVLMAVAVLLILSILANFIQYHYTSTATHDVMVKDNIIKTTISDLKRHTDSTGANHVVFDPKSNVVKQSLAQYSRTLDTIANQIGEKKNSISDYTKVAMSVSDSNLPAKRGYDSTSKRQTATYKDKTFDLRYNFPFGTDTAGTFDPAANIDLDVVNYTKRAWALASLRSYTDIFSPDKRVRIRGVDRLVIEQKQPTFGLRIRGSATYNTRTQGFSAGPEAAFDIGNNQIRVNYYYNPATRIWSPTVSLSHDFIRF